MTVYQNGGGSSVPPPPPLVCRPHLNPASPPLLSPLDPSSRLSPLHPPFHYEDGAAPPATHAATTPMPVAGEARTCCSGAAGSAGDTGARRTKLHETYITVEARREREAERRLAEAWKRKRRRGEAGQGAAEHLRSAPLGRVRHPLQESVVAGAVSGVAGVLATCLLSVPLALLLLLVLPLALLAKGLAAACRLPRAPSCLAACHGDYLSPHDAQFLLQEADPRAVMHSVLVIDAAMNLKRVKQLLAARVVEARTGAGALLYPRFTQTVTWLAAGPAWVHDATFSLHNHVFEGPAVASEEALHRYVGALLSQPLPTARPLWEVIVLHDYGRSRDTVLVCRLHHCLSDGMSLVRVLCQSLSDNQIMHIPQKPHFGGTTYGMNLARGLLVGPLTALTWLLAWRPQLNPLTLLRGSACPPPPRRAAPACCCCCGGREEVSAREANEGGGAYTVWGEGEGAGEGQVVVWGAGVTVGGVVRVKQVTRTCLNDVLLAAVAGALRLTLQRRGVRHPRDLRASVAVDLRSSPPPFSVPRLGTKAALVPLSLPLSWDAAIPRLWEVRARVDDMKASAEAVVAYGLVWWAYKLLPAPLTRSLLRHLYRRCSVQYSSLPGPTSPLLLGGYTVKHIYNISPPRDPTPLSVTVLTYADQVHVSVAARSSMPAAPAVARLLLQEFQNQCIQMCELLANRRIPGEQRRGMVFTPGELGRGHSLSELQEKLRRVQTELTEVTQLWEATRRNALAHPPRPQEAEEEEQEEGGGVTAGSALLGRNSGPGSGAGAKGGRGRLPHMEEALCTRVQHLKGEFTNLLAEIRRRKSVSEGRVVGVGSQTEFEEDDGEVRRPRKRALSAASTWSTSSGTNEVSSCLARPLTTPTQHTPTSLPPASHPSRGCLVTDIT
ncbi:uncharacterized protein LOC123502747 [Portunus trituberculatus]|uniref:uncharacterized protein LOC123502747 n=1 Tax=Portunus trituberculatus TaxID=210409 RepID=UPI001E1CE2C3|nr:uncharacterized protein LOC123502747 [Portunus trituberculatus]